MRPVFQNFTRIARSMRFSIFFRSGAKPGNVSYFSGPGGITPTSCPAEPLVENICGTPAAQVFPTHPTP